MTDLSVTDINERLKRLEEREFGKAAGPLPDATGIVGEDTVRRSTVIPTTELADGDFVTVRVYVPVGETLSVYAAGVEDDSNNAPAGLTAEVDTESGGAVQSNELSANTRHTTGDPLCTVSGGNAAAFRVENDTGGTVGASGWFEYDIE